MKNYVIEVEVLDNTSMEEIERIVGTALCEASVECTYNVEGQQGLNVKLPFNVGDTVYIIIGKNVSRQKIVWIELRDNEILFITRRRKFSNSDIGECVFHTKEEAEKALVDSRLN